MHVHINASDSGDIFCSKGPLLQQERYQTLLTTTTNWTTGITISRDLLGKYGTSIKFGEFNIATRHFMDHRGANNE